MDAARAPASAKPPSGRKMKARAPPPPGKMPPHNAHSEQKPPQDISPSPSPMLSMQEQLQNSMVDITVVLPSGLEKKSLINGSYAMMDLLVELCLQNHLNPSHHALEIRSSDTQQPLSFKPNTLVGTLDVHTIFLREKVPEEKSKTGPTRVPEKSVRLVVNYLRTQKAVVRVSPEVPLQNILPAICAKCEVSPEHVILLRDNIDGEELELSKSLNELGIKELYAWDNKRETFRKSSLANDEADKEKKKFLGFFKVNKRSNSKTEHLGLSGANSEEDATKSIAGGLNGCLTTPNTPSSKSRSLTTGPSLSLSNISGVSVKSDMKKRRAPPPPSQPSPGPPVQDKAPEKVSMGSQIDLKKKKRRAPAPPPPPLQPPPLSPLIPNRMEDKEEKRKSATGVGRLVPQKPPRGTARGPPQLVLPPPPPYPPPDIDLAEPPGFPGEGAVAEASDLRLTLSLPLGSVGHCNTDGVSSVPAEAEETVSVGSCFASEDTTEDSGVMSSPSDIISLDSQHDSTKSKDKWATDQEDCSDQELAVTPERGPQRSPSWERSGSGNWHSRSEKVTVASNDDGDEFFTGQFQKALADLDEDLDEKMEETYESDTSSLTNSTSCVSSLNTQEVIISNSDADTIPVTFIGEVLDDPVDSGMLSNRNNNAGSFDLSSSARRIPRPPNQTEHSQQPQQTSRNKGVVCNSSVSSYQMGMEIKPPLPNTSNNVNQTKQEHTKTSASSLHTSNLNTKAQDWESPDYEKKQDLERVSSHSVRDKDGDSKNKASTQLPWYQREQNPGGSYGIKYGLTTYKIVPPKSDMKYYDRGVSLTTGAIKIDELGNLVNPHVNRGRTVAPESPTPEEQTQPIEKVKEFWKSNSIKKLSGQSTESMDKRTPVDIPAEVGSKPRAEPISPDPRVVAIQPSQQENGKHMEDGGSQTPVIASGRMKVPASNATEFSFLKPQRRTSSQYVASAIAKRIGPPKAPTQVVRKYNDAWKTSESRVPEVMEQPPTINNRTTSSPPLETHAQVLKDDAKLPSVHLPSTNGEEATIRMNPREDAFRGSYGKFSTQDNLSGTHRRSFAPAGTSLHSGKHHTSNPQVFSASEIKHTPDHQHPPSSHSVENQALGKVFMGNSRRIPISNEPPQSPTASSTNGYAKQGTLHQGEKPGVSCTDIDETDSALTSDIFGPKKKFKPVVQKPVPKETSLHSALMEAIHSAGGKERLRKTTQHTSERKPKKPSYMESESEHSALMAAIRGHGGTSSLRKVSSFASEELRSFRDASLSTAGAESPRQEDAGVHIPPPPPPSLPPAPQPPSGPFNDPADARQALMDAIRSGTGAARLRKVPLLV